MELPLKMKFQPKIVYFDNWSRPLSEYYHPDALDALIVWRFDFRVFGVSDNAFPKSPRIFLVTSWRDPDKRYSDEITLPIVAEGFEDFWKKLMQSPAFLNHLKEREAIVGICKLYTLDGEECGDGDKFNLEGYRIRYQRMND